MSMKCPTCFHDLPQNVEVVVCLDCPPEDLESLTPIYGLDRPTHRAVPLHEGCKAGHRLSAQEACPRCHALIPFQWREKEETRFTFIALAGARTTGKSTYIGVLDRQLEILVERSGSYLERLGETEDYFMRAYGEALFREGRRLDPTVVAEHNRDSHRALMYRFADASGQPRILVIRDVAGEDIEYLKSMERPQLDFLRRADGLIVLLDPLHFPVLKQVLQGVIDEEQIGGDGLAVVKSLLQLAQGSEGQVGIDMAIVLGKIDLLWSAGETPGFLPAEIVARPGSPLNRDPSMSSLAFDEREGNLIHEEVRSFFRVTIGASLDSLLREHGAVHRYFAVSALGAHTHGDGISEQGISPFRVVDPLKWVMS